MASELLKGLLHRDESEVKDRLKSFGQSAIVAGGLGYAGYKGFQQSNIVNTVNNAVTSLNRDPEFYRVGRKLAENAEALKAIQSRAKTTAMKAYSSSLEFDTLSGADTSKAFYASVFDVLKKDGMTDDLRKILEQGYKDASSLTNEQKTRISSAFDSIKSSPERLETFKGSYTKLSGMSNQLTNSSGDFIATSNQIKMEEFGDLSDSKLSSILSESQTNGRDIQGRLKEIQKRVGKGNKIKIVGFDESGSGIRSLYAQVSFGSRNLNIPLYLAKDANGNIVYRASENLSTRYVAPLKVLNATTIFSTTSLSSAQTGQLSNGPGTMNFEDYVFHKLPGGHGALSNMTDREIMNFYEFQRSFGVNAPRGMFENFAQVTNDNGTRFVSESFQQSMAYARASQSSRFLIAGLESMDPKLQQDVAKRLMQMYPDEVRASGYPYINRLVNPFNRSEELSFTDIGTGKGSTPFNALARYGRIDEIIQEQTAREFQMFGRYEMASGIVGLDNSAKFGAKRNIITFGSAAKGELIGVDSAGGKGIHGVNLASIMISGDARKRATGLGEGMSYFGGTMKVNSSISNTVYDTGLARTKLLEELIRKSKDPNNKFLTIGGKDSDYSIEDFFKIFGNNKGEAVIGFRDQEIAKIVRRQGMESFTLGLTEMSVEGGRTRYHIGGELVQGLDRTKMFSTIIKDTTIGLDRAGFENKLNELFSGQGTGLSDQFFNNLNVDVRQALMSTDDMLKKSPQFLSSQIAGSLRLFGFEELAYKTKMEELVGDDTRYLNYINKMKGGHTDLSLVGEKVRKAAYVRASIESALSVIKNGGAVSGFTQEEVIGRILGGSREYAGRFGMGSKFGTDDFDTFFKATATTLGISNVDNSLAEIQKGITFTAHYVSSGGVHTDYGRNLAKVEPRFMNYLYTSLRGNFGLSEEQSTKYLSSLLIRQEGADARPAAMIGMKLTSFGLSNMRDKTFQNQLSALTGINKIDTVDLNKLISSQDESEISDILSRYTSGSILDFEDFIKDKPRLDMIKDSLGGRTQIFLPGSETLESLKGYTVSQKGETIDINNQFTRYLADLTQSIGGMQEATSDEQFTNNFYGFKVAKSSIAKVGGLALRHSLTGRILGSGTYLGQGIVFGQDPRRSKAGSTSLKSNMLGGLYEALEAKKGYAIFQDTQGFLDSMSSFQEAMTKQLRADNFADGDENAILKEARRLTGARVKDFAFGMYKPEKSGVSVTVQRNPNIFLAHYMPGIELMRYDYAEGAEDPMLKLMYMGRGKLKAGVFKTALDEAILTKRNALLAGEGRTVFKNTDDMKRHFARKIEIQKLIGVPEYELDNDGKILQKTIQTKGKVNPFTGEIEYQDKNVRRMTGLSFLDEVDGEITRSRTSPSSDTERYAALLQEKMAEKRALIEQKLKAQSTIIKREAAIKGAYVVDSSDPTKIKTETIKRYITEQKIDNEIVDLEARLISASDEEKVKIEAEIQRKKANKSALKKDGNGKTYLEREARVRDNLALSEARAKLEQANRNIARAKVEAAKLKVAQKEMRSSVAIRRNIVNNALGYLSTTLQGRNKILTEAKKYKGFHDQIKTLLAARPFDDNLDINQRTGRLRRSAVVALQATPNPDNPYKGSMVYTNDFFSQVMGIRESSIRRSSDRLAKQVFDFQHIEGFIKDGVRIESFLDAGDNDFFDADKIQRNLDEKTKAFNDLFNSTRAAKSGLDATAGGKRPLNFEEALEVFRQQFLAVNKSQAPNVSNLGEDLFSFFDDQVVPSSQKRPDFTPRQLRRYGGMFRAYQEMENAQLIKDKIERLKKQKEDVRFNLSRLAGLEEEFTFDATSRQPPRVTLTSSFMGIPTSGNPFALGQLRMTSEHKLSITPRMVADYFEINMKTLIRNSLNADRKVDLTRSKISELKTLISDLINRITPSEKIDENKRLIEDTIALIRGTSTQGGTTREPFLNQTSKILEENIQTRTVGNQTNDTFKPRFEYLKELGELGSLDSITGDERKALNTELERTIDAFYSGGKIAVSTEDVRRAIEINPNLDDFYKNLSAFYGFNQGSGLAEIQYDEQAFFKDGNRLKKAKEAFYASGRFSKNPIEMLLSRFDTRLSDLFGGEYRNYKVFENGVEKEVTSFIFKEELPIFEARQKAYTDKAAAEKERKEALEGIKAIEADQKTRLDADDEYQAAKQSKLAAEARIAEIDAELANDPGRAEYDNLRTELNALNERTRGVNFSTARLSDDEINTLRTGLFANPDNVDSAPGLISQLETLNSGKRITTMEEFYNAYAAHSTNTININGTPTTVEEATNEVFFKALGKHLKTGNVGGGVVHFPQFEASMDLMVGDRRVGGFESRLDFSRFAIGDFDADIYQIYHDTTNVMRQRFQDNAESFHGLFNTGTEFLIHMKELGKGAEEYGKRLGAGSLNISEFRMDQYEKERILKSVGGLDVQIKVGMLGLAHSMADSTDGAFSSDYFSRLRTGASLIAVAQESLIIKAKHMNIAADIGQDFLTAMKTSYSAGTGDALFDYFKDNLFKGTMYEGLGMDDEIRIANTQFLNLPANSKTAESLKRSIEGDVKFTLRSIKESMDTMSRTVKSRGYHALGSDSRLFKTLESGDAFNMDQLIRLLSVSMEGGFTGDINIDQIEEIMNTQRTMRQEIGMNIGRMSRAGGGYLAAAALGVSYLAGVKTSPEVLDSASKFSDMRARESIGGRQLHNMTTREHGNVSPSRFSEPMNMYDRPINMGETMVTKNNSVRMYGEAPTYTDAMMSARKITGAGGNAFLGIQDARMPISNSYVTKSIRD
jgi:hypothetical protein